MSSDETERQDDGPHFCGWCGSTYYGAVCSCASERFVDTESTEVGRNGGEDGGE